MLSLRQQQFLWMIFSPDLLSTAYSGDSSTFKSVSNQEQIQHLLSKIVEDNDINSLSHSIRLGILFESLLHFYLLNVQQTTDMQASKMYCNAINRLQVNSFEKPTRTLGEFDFLYTDNQGETSHHLEAAVKFYLADVDKLEDLSTLSSWIGPNRNDRLDLKVGKLFDQQLQLTYRPEAKIVLENHNYIGSIKKQFFIKGILFLPYTLVSNTLTPNIGASNTRSSNNHPEYLKHLPKTINPDNEFGYWVHISHVSKLLEELRFAKILDRQEWLTFSPTIEKVLYSQIKNNELTATEEEKEVDTSTEKNTKNNSHSEKNFYSTLKARSENEDGIIFDGYTHLISGNDRELFLRSLTHKLLNEKKPFQVSGIRYLEGKTRVKRYFIVSDDWSATTTPSCNQ